MLIVGLLDFWKLVAISETRFSLLIVTRWIGARWTNLSSWTYFMHWQLTFWTCPSGIGQNKSNSVTLSSLQMYYCPSFLLDVKTGDGGGKSDSSSSLMSTSSSKRLLGDFMEYSPSGVTDASKCFTVTIRLPGTCSELTSYSLICN